MKDMKEGQSQEVDQQVYNCDNYLFTETDQQVYNCDNYLFTETDDAMMRRSKIFALICNNLLISSLYVTLMSFDEVLCF